ncbi:MAG: hypothetical protein PHU85_08465 [Phycisphaerae bacterium]|nr:hypothetical protein [Phycisphaerae bacterium]
MSILQPASGPPPRPALRLPAAKPILAQLGGTVRHLAGFGPEHVVEIAIANDGRLFCEREEVRLWMLRERLVAAMAEHPRVSFRVMGDHLIPGRAGRDDQNDMLIEALDLCQRLRLGGVVVNADVLGEFDCNRLFERRSATRED